MTIANEPTAILHNAGDALKRAETSATRAMGVTIHALTACWHFPLVFEPNTDNEQAIELGVLLAREESMTSTEWATLFLAMGLKYGELDAVGQAQGIKSRIKQCAGLAAILARNVGFDNIKVISKDRIANVPVSAVYPATDETGKLTPQGKLYADKFIQEQESQGEEGLEYDSPSVIKAAEKAMNADKFVVGGKSPTLGMVTFTNAANAGKRNAEQMGLMPKRSQTRNKQINPDSVSFQNSLDAVERVLCQFVDPTGQSDVAPTNAMLAQLIRIGDKIDETIGRYGEQAFDTLPDSE